jgi:hypothetical protein
MAQRNQMYQALRRRQKPVSNPQIAPIAALFEDCRQNFERLCVTARGVSDPNSGVLDPNSILIEDNYGKFLAWGNDTGASSRSLDHTLRKDYDLSVVTLDLLKTLYEKLNQGMPPKFLSSVPFFSGNVMLTFRFPKESTEFKGQLRLPLSLMS